MTNTNPFFPPAPLRIQVEIPDRTDPNESWSGFLKIMQDIWKNEETRFNNLNTRGVAIVSATSIVTTVLGFFAKELFTAPANLSPLGLAAGSLTTLAIVLLVLTAGFIVLGVLKPGGRSIFGGNSMLGEVVDGVFHRGTTVEAGDVDWIASKEYAGIYEGLANRNLRKAFWLNWAYLTFFLALVFSAVAAGILIWV